MNATTVQLVLEPLDSTDIGICRAWRNDWEIWKWCRQTDLISDAEQAQWFRDQADDPSIRMYKLVAREGEGEAPVGICGFTSIRPVHRSAEFSLFIAPQAQRKGLGERGLSLLLDHGFSNLGFNTIWGETFEGNPAASIFLRLGLRKEGGMRQAYWKDGRFVDSHFYSITAEDWHEHKRTHDDICRSKHHHIAGDPPAREQTTAGRGAEPRSSSLAGAGSVTRLAPRQSRRGARGAGAEDAPPRDCH